jgi:hypothetical protein
MTKRGRLQDERQLQQAAAAVAQLRPPGMPVPSDASKTPPGEDRNEPSEEAVKDLEEAVAAAGRDALEFGNDNEEDTTRQKNVPFSAVGLSALAGLLGESRGVISEARKGAENEPDSSAGADRVAAGVPHSGSPRRPGADPRRSGRSSGGTRGDDASGK